MKKKLYFLVESTGELSETVKSLAQTKKTIAADFEYETSEGTELENLQYTITPQLLTHQEFRNLPEY